MIEIRRDEKEAVMCTGSRRRTAVRAPFYRRRRDGKVYKTWICRE